MNLKIGTILIAKEDRFMFANDKQFLTKGKEYVIDKIEGQYITIKSDLYDEHVFKDTKINESFTIKRYTLSDLQERTDLMVRIDNEEQAKKLQDAGLAFVYKSYYEPYYGFTEGFVWLTKNEQKGRILLESIDEIDLGEEGKEEVVNQPFYIQQLESEIARLKAELDKSQEAGKCIAEKLADEMKEKVAYMEEVNRLKGENEDYKHLVSKLESDLNRMNMEAEIVANQYSGLLTDIAQLKRTIKQLESTFIQDLRPSPELEKRERMAWEIWLQGRYTVEQAIEKVNRFLEESKEVGNG